MLLGFAELQTDMTDLTKELNRSQGIPFLEYKQFVTRTFFPKVRNFTLPCYLIFAWQSDNTIFLSGVLIFLLRWVPFTLLLTLFFLQDKISPWNL